MYACGDGELAHDQQLAWPARSKAGGRRSGPSPAGGASRWQGQVQRIAEYHHPSRKSRLGPLGPSPALVESHREPTQMPGQEPGATGNMHRAPRWQTTHQFDHPVHLGVPPRSIAIGEGKSAPPTIRRGPRNAGRGITRSGSRAKRGQTRRHDRRTPPRAGSCPSQTSRSRTPIRVRVTEHPELRVS